MSALVRPDIAALREARRTLTRMAASYRDTAYQCDSVSAVRNACYAEAACDRAEQAVFDVLNTLSSYLEDPDAAAVLRDEGVAA